MDFLKLKGLIAPAFTPMKRNRDLALERIPAYAEDLIKKGLSGAFIAGSSGEGILLTTEERKALTEAWAPYASEDFKLIVHVGSSSIRQSQELAIHANDHNAWSISSIGPTFFRPKRTEELVDYCYEIASVVTELPFYYYHIPLRSGINIRMTEFLELGGDRIPNLAGIKFNHSDLFELQQCMALRNGKFDILHGSDPTLLCGLAVGIKGAIGTTYNFIPKSYQNIMAAFEKGDIATAQKVQQFAVKVVEILSKYGGGVIAGKAIQKMAGIDCGPCRTPLKSLSKKEINRMSAELKEVGFFKAIGDN